jgi:Putative peptidoglycan binding domain
MDSQEEENEEDVKLLQQVVRILYPESMIEPNGRYGRFTCHYIKNFQESQGIKVDGLGVVGNITFFKLRGNVFGFLANFFLRVLDECLKKLLKSNSKLKDAIEK